MCFKPVLLFVIIFYHAVIQRIDRVCFFRSLWHKSIPWKIFWHITELLMYFYLSVYFIITSVLFGIKKLSTLDTNGLVLDHFNPIHITTPPFYRILPLYFSAPNDQLPDTILQNIVMWLSGVCYILVTQKIFHCHDCILTYTHKAKSTPQTAWCGPLS